MYLGEEMRKQGVEGIVKDKHCSKLQAVVESYDCQCPEATQHIEKDQSHSNTFTGNK